MRRNWEEVREIFPRAGSGVEDQIYEVLISIRRMGFRLGNLTDEKGLISLLGDKTKKRKRGGVKGD